MSISDDVAQPQRRAGYVARSWRGELSLPRAFFVNLLGGTMAFCAVLLLSLIAIFLVEASGEARASLRLTLALLVATAILFWLLIAWQLVGVWRSASRYLDDGGRPFLAFVAYATVLLWTGWSLTEIPTEWREIAKTRRLLALEAASHTDFKVAVEGGVLSVSGLIGPKMVERVVAELQGNADIRIVQLDSGGGFLTAGDRLASAVRERGLVTFVSERCASACTIVYLAGRERWLGPEGRLGFHAATSALEDERANEYFRELYARAGVATALVDRFMKVPADDMWYPPTTELTAAALVTRIVDDPRAELAGQASIEKVSDESDRLAASRSL